MLRILLADDDKDDCYFFKMALDALDIATVLTIVSDGEKLMVYLSENALKHTDVLFLDLNMPRKNGFECLSEIKQNPALRDLPVIIFSTSFEKEVVKQLYLNGANYFIRKPSEFSQYERIIQHAVSILQQGISLHTSKEDFVINLNNTNDNLITKN